MKKLFIILALIAVGCTTEEIDSIEAVQSRAKTPQKSWITNGDRGLEEFLKATYNKNTVGEFTDTWSYGKRNTPKYGLLIVNPFKAETIPTVDGVRLYSNKFYYLFIEDTGADRILTFMNPNGELIYIFINIKAGEVFVY